MEIRQNSQPTFWKMRPNKTCIIILNYNGKEDTLNCLESLQRVDETILVVDNGSRDDSAKAIATQYPGCTLLRNEVNLGYAGGNNVGISYGLKMGFAYFFILNNDTILDPNCVETLVHRMEKEAHLGILGACPFRMDQPDTLDHLGGIWNPKTHFFEYVGYKQKKEFLEMSQPLDYVCGAAILVKRSVFETIGLFDPRFFLFWEEADLCARAQRAGFGVTTCLDAIVYHRISASFSGGKPHASYFASRNRFLWIEKNITGIQRPFILAKRILQNLLLSSFSIAVRSVQIGCQKVLGKKTIRNQDRILRAQAVQTATLDYLFRRFYEGRSKKFSKPEKSLFRL